MLARVRCMISDSIAEAARRGTRPKRRRRGTQQRAPPASGSGSSRSRLKQWRGRAARGAQIDTQPQAASALRKLAAGASEGTRVGSVVVAARQHLLARGVQVQRVLVPAGPGWGKGREADKQRAKRRRSGASAACRSLRQSLHTAGLLLRRGGQPARAQSGGRCGRAGGAGGGRARTARCSSP